MFFPFLSALASSVENAATVAIQAVFMVFAVFVSWREFGEELRPLLRPMHLGQAVCSGGL